MSRHSSQVTAKKVKQHHSSWLFSRENVDDLVQVELHRVLSVHQGQSTESILAIVDRR